MGIYSEALRQIINGFPMTMSLTILAITLALVLGILLALGMASASNIVHTIFAIVSSFLKGISLLVC